MNTFRQLDHLLADNLGWSLYCAPLLRVGLKWTGWWALYVKLQHVLYEGGDWAEWFPDVSVRVDGLDELPISGGYSIWAEHPLGFFDGWAIGIALKDRLDRVAFFAHPVAAEFPALKSHTIAMKPGLHSGKLEAQASIRKGAQHMASGGILIRFNPANDARLLNSNQRVIRAEITPIWVNGINSRKVGSLWTWLWMPRRLCHLLAIEVRFTSSYQV